MRKSRVLLAGVAVAAAAVATSAFTASNDFDRPTQRRRLRRGRPSPARRHQHRLQPRRRRTSRWTTSSSPSDRRDLDAGVTATMTPQAHGVATAGGANHRARSDLGPPPRASPSPATLDRARALRDFDERRPHGRLAVTLPRNGRGGRIGRPARPGTGAFAMNAATRAASISAVAALVLAAVWLFWPLALGGGTTYVTTHGISMEPRLPHRGPGDPAPGRHATPSATSSPTAASRLDTIVMHRIVVRDGDRLRDPGRQQRLARRGPARPQDEILGRLFLRIPQGGKALAALRSPGSLVVVAAARRSPSLGAARRAPRPARGAGRARRRPRDARPFSMPTRARARQVALGSGAVVARRGRRRAACCSLLPATQTDTRTVRGDPAGPVLLHRRGRARHHLPDGRRSPPATPSGRGSPSGLTVSFTNTVTGPDLADVRGAHAARRRRSPPPTAGAPSSTSGPAVGPGGRDGDRRRRRRPGRAPPALLSRHYAEIGTPGGPATLTVTPVAETTGTVAGRALHRRVRRPA